MFCFGNGSGMGTKENSSEDACIQYAHFLTKPELRSSVLFFQLNITFRVHIGLSLSPQRTQILYHHLLYLWSVSTNWGWEGICWQLWLVVNGHDSSDLVCDLDIVTVPFSWIRQQSLWEIRKLRNHKPIAWNPAFMIPTSMFLLPHDMPASCFQIILKMCPLETTEYIEGKVIRAAFRGLVANGDSTTHQLSHGKPFELTWKMLHTRQSTLWTLPTVFIFPKVPLPSLLLCLLSSYFSLPDPVIKCLCVCDSV